MEFPSLHQHRCRYPNAIFIVFMFILMMVSTGTVKAQDTSPTSQDAALDSLTIDIWPEYDQPSVLVIYHITLSSQVKLPAALTFRIPKEVGQPHAVAMQDVAGLYNLNYDIAQQGDWVQISFTTPVPNIRVEYYDPTLKIDNQQRNFTFRWPGDYTVQNLVLQVQQPSNASEMTFTPNQESEQTVQDGITYHALKEGQVNAGTAFDLKIAYRKPDNRLTSQDSFSPAQPIQPIDNRTAGRVSPIEMLPWILGGFGVLLIVIGLLWYWKAGQAQQAEAVKAGRPRHPSRHGTASPTPVSNEEGPYCHQCGKRAAPGDQFCRACGTKLR